MPSQKKLLVYVQEDILGDALMKLPALATLRNNFPDHKITWFSGRGKSLYRTLLSPLASDFIDEFIEKNNFATRWSGLINKNQVKEGYDVVIDTQHSIKTTLFLKRIPHNVFISPTAGFLFSDRKPTAANPYQGSLRDKVLCLFNLVNNNTEVVSFELCLPDEYTFLANRLLPDRDNYVGFAPGAGGKNKIWPLNSFVNIALAQTNKNRLPVFFLGPGEQHMLEHLRTKVPGALFPEAENKDTKLGGPLLAMALSRKLRVALANDSGMGHVFATAGCSLVSLFGPTNTKKFVASMNNRITIKASDYGSNDMSAIPEAPVLEAIEELY